MATVTFFHAHPDDEAIATGGTMLRLAEAGHRVVLLTATRGELGEQPEGLLEPGESLVERRDRELREACRILGVGRHEFLDYLDSGMAGTPENDRPGSFATADLEEAAAAVARVLDDEDSDVLIIYDEHGGYGHPDHIQVHRVGMRAAELAATPVVYMATINRDVVIELATQSDSPGWQPPEEVAERMDTMGEPAERITTEVDVSPWIDRKRQAMQAHASQIPDTSFFLTVPEELFSTIWGREWYIRVRPDLAAGTKEADLLLSAADDAAGSTSAAP